MIGSTRPIQESHKASYPPKLPPMTGRRPLMMSPSPHKLPHMIPHKTRGKLVQWICNYWESVDVTWAEKRFRPSWVDCCQHFRPADSLSQSRKTNISDLIWVEGSDIDYGSGRFARAVLLEFQSAGGANNLVASKWMSLWISSDGGLMQSRNLGGRELTHRHILEPRSGGWGRAGSVVSGLVWLESSAGFFGNICGGCRGGNRLGAGRPG